MKKIKSKAIKPNSNIDKFLNWWSNFTMKDYEDLFKFYLFGGMDKYK